MEKSRLVLKPGREKPVLRRHPWIFSGAVQEIVGEPKSGDVILILSHTQEILGSAIYSETSQISARVFHWGADRSLDESWFREKFTEAKTYRDLLNLDEITNAKRLIFSEADGIPGLVVDQLGDGLALQFTTWGMENRKDIIIRVLHDIWNPDFIYEDGSAEVRRLEGLPQKSGIIFGELPIWELLITEHSLKYKVKLEGGQKTGFYLDQRDNRKMVRQYAEGKAVLDCFSYSGGFALNAAKAGAEKVTLIDSSSDALKLAEKNITLNEFDLEKFEIIEADVFQQLRTFRDSRRSFDLIILDPPKFAPIAKHREKAARAYKDINLWAFKLLNPGGILFTFSCSGGINRDFFQKIVADGAVDAGVATRVIEDLSQAADHPIALNFPESRYLKGMVVRRG